MISHLPKSLINKKSKDENLKTLQQHRLSKQKRKTHWVKVFPEPEEDKVWLPRISTAPDSLKEEAEGCNISSCEQKADGCNLHVTFKGWQAEAKEEMS